MFVCVDGKDRRMMQTHTSPLPKYCLYAALYLQVQKSVRIFHLNQYRGPEVGVSSAVRF